MILRIHPNLKLVCGALLVHDLLTISGPNVIVFFMIIKEYYRFKHSQNRISPDRLSSFLLPRCLNSIFMFHPQLTTLPNPEYMALQKELAWSMRGILLDWLVQVRARF